ncbi:DASS family sodium-coupled anion symporter [Helicobacter cetorum]|uniref:Sodium-dependent transporter n=1 Tax=Helicobacter cetorum (strain ATCC BAA-540 / CCUG 52418 / MIT 99-5656) TaxID=1163745 RepID=I0EUH3_HELCM|nr:DASS family sodium-coupled anion symporter [Helicobacter cetorum]AFI06592.1 sodium-dependent transporter [Helicobacter cetorum MIT 99-5656]
MENNSYTDDKSTKIVRVVGLIGGVLLALIVYYALHAQMPYAIEQIPKLSSLNSAAMPIVASVSILMGVWWMTEAIDLPATALLPLVLFSVFGVDKFASVSASYASPIIFLFMGGFILALGMQKWNLHTRIALSIILLVGTSPRRLILGFMIATGFLSMWVSNTATAVMMLPVGLSVLHLVAKLVGTENKEKTKRLQEEITKAHGGIMSHIVHKGKDITHAIQEKSAIYRTNFSICLMLGIAYSASIGSLGTLIGTPPNALLAGYMKTAFNIEIGFSQWMVFGVPLAFIMLLLAWLLLTYVIFPLKIKEIPGGKEVVRAELHKLGRLSQAEILVGIIFILASLGWIFLGTLLKNYGIKVDKIDSVIAMGVSVLLFILPANNKGERLIDWDTTKKLPWDVLLLFGGGLALSAQFSKTGLSLWIGHLVSSFSHLPILLIIVVVTLMVIFLTEITSNTATAAAFLPVIGGVAMGMGYEGQSSLLFTIPVALSATCAFMLPVATPPNAIAYGSGYVKIADMIKAGLWLNLVGVVLISAFCYMLTGLVFGS